MVPRPSRDSGNDGIGAATDRSSRSLPAAPSPVQCGNAAEAPGLLAHWIVPTPLQAMKKTSYPKQDMRVLLLEGVSQTAVDTFHAAGYSNVELHARSLPEDELRRRIADARFVGIRSRTQLTAGVLAEARRLLAVGCFCIGTNQVDTEAAQLAGIPVFNAPYSNTRSVAELVLAQAIMLLRGVPQKNALCHRGGWSKSAAGSHEARGKTIGIVGYGHIGTQVGVL